MEVDAGEAEAVGFDDAVDAFIAGFADDSGGVFRRAAVAHRDDELDHHALELVRGQLDDFLKQFVLQAALDERIGLLKIFDGRSVGRLRRLGGGAFFGRHLRLDKFPEFRKLHQVLLVDFRRVFEKRCLAEVRDPDDRALRGFEEPRLHEVRLRPADAVVIQKLAAARQVFGAVGVGQSEVVRQIGVEIPELVLAAVREALQEGLHEFVVFRHGHLKSPQRKQRAGIRVAAELFERKAPDIVADKYSISSYHLLREMGVPGLGQEGGIVQKLPSGGH